MASAYNATVSVPSAGLEADQLECGVSPQYGDRVSVPSAGLEADQLGGELIAQGGKLWFQYPQRV